MEGKEEDRSTGKNTLLDVFYALHTGDETTAECWRSGVRLICSSVILLPTSSPCNLASFCSCIFDASLPINFLHSACKQAQDSFLTPKALDSHPLIPCLFV